MESKLKSQDFSAMKTRLIKHFPEKQKKKNKAGLNNERIEFWRADS